ncbi:uncharacterized protein [Coffea arabica]|uniref:Uncharacterized protein n=1 Tax=Coffea arabica TaxID=13443 RepID=A0A6P6SN68_COFAR|nr:uncharacterized protein LOC113692910 [Coffea arabica]
MLMVVYVNVGVNRFWAMDPELLPVTPNEYGTFHAMDRALYSLLAVDLWRDPYESVQIMALWLWMERLGFKNLVLTILSMPPMLINKYADEALTCVKCVNDPQFVLSAEVNEIPATSRLVKKRITLQYFHENRPIVVKELRNVVTETCAMALQDVIEDAVKKHNAYESLVNSFSNLGFVGEACGDYRNANGASQEERTMFVTFSKGYPVAESEVTEFFTKLFGNCIEAFHMQPVRSDEQPLYARVVFSTPKVIDLILGGVTKAKFTINGKHLWMRKFVPKRKSSFPRSRRP